MLCWIGYDLQTVWNGRIHHVYKSRFASGCEQRGDVRRVPEIRHGRVEQRVNDRDELCAGVDAASLLAAR
jgi:hypothetical protein